MTINLSAIQGIISTLKMAIRIIRITGTIQRVKVKTTYKTNPMSYQTVTMHVTNMSLRDSITSFRAI